MNLKRIVRAQAGFTLTIAVVLSCCGDSGLGVQAAVTEPLALKLPAPALKGTIIDLPVGPNIEPYSDKAPPPFLVPKGVKNLAAGCTVTSGTPPWRAQLSQITDGKKEALDYDTVEMKKGTQWVQVDLGGPRLIYAIVMWHDHRYVQTMHDVIVQGSDDPEFRKGVTTLFNNDRDNSSNLGLGTDLEYFETIYGRTIDGKGLKVRYVRCYTNGSNLTRLNSWQELEVYGLPVDSKSGAPTLSSTNAPTAGTEPLKLQLPSPALK
jgi:hypothetical protein